MRSRTGSIAFTLGLFFLCLYLVTFRGISTGDNIYHYVQVESVVKRGSLSLPQQSLLNTDRDFSPFFAFGREGLPYMTLPPGLALASLPFGLLGSIVSDITENNTSSVLVSGMLSDKTFGPEDAISTLGRTPQGMVTTLINPLATAALIAVFFLFSLELSGSIKKSLILSLVLGCCTIVWPYSSSFWTQPLNSLCLFTALYLLYIGKGKRLLVPAGLLMGYAVLTRYETMIFMPFYLYYIFSTYADNKWNRYRAMLIFTLGFGAVMLLLGTWNLYRFGSLFDTGAGHQRMPSFTWNGNLLESVPSNLIGPNRSIFLYSPPLVLGIIGFTVLLRKKKELAWTIIMASSAAFLMYCIFSLWFAAASWGPRFLVILVPFLLLPASLLKFEEGWKRILFRVLIPLGLLIQLIAVIIPIQISYIGNFWGNMGMTSRSFLSTDIVPQFVRIFSTPPDFWWTRGSLQIFPGLVLLSLLIITGRRVIWYSRRK